METRDYPRLEAVLKEFADELGYNYADTIERNGHNASRALSKAAADPGLHRIEVERDGYLVVFDLPSYWKYIEHGLAPSGRYNNPGWKAYPAIRRWIDVKPVIPRPGRNGRIPSPDSLAYLITRKIVNKGTDGTHDLATSRDRTLPWWMDRIREAFAADLQEDLDEVLLKGIGGRVIEGRL